MQWVTYSFCHAARILRCVFYTSEVKKKTLRCMQRFQRCRVLAGLLAQSPALTNRQKQKAIVYPFEDNRATVWHRQSNNEFSWERYQSEAQKSANTDAFHTGQNVHCVPAAFCIYSEKLKYPPFSRCSRVVPPARLVSDELETLDCDYWRKRSQRQLPLHFQPLPLLKNSRQE